MFPLGPLEILFLAIGVSIVIRPLTRAFTEIARSRERAPAPDQAMRELVESLETRLRLLEERQDFTDKLLTGRTEPGAGTQGNLGAGAPPRPAP
jgi:hypothetical protein